MAERIYAIAQVGDVRVRLTGDSTSLRRSLSRSTEGLKKFGRQAKIIGLAAAAALTAVAVAAVKSADSIEGGLRKIKIGTGATGNSLRNLENNFRTVFKGVPQSAAEVGDTIASLNTILGASGPVLTKLSKQFLDVSRIMGEDASGNAIEFARAMKQFGIPVERGSELLEKFFKITQDTGIPLGRLISLTKEYGSVLLTADFSIEETASLFARLSSAGLNVTRISPGLNAAFRNWAKEGKKPREELGKLIEAMKKAETRVRAVAIGVDVFGAEGIQRLTTAIRTGVFNLDDLTEGLGNTEGGIDRASKSSVLFSEQLGILGNKLKLILEPIGTVLIEVMTGLIDAFFDTAEETEALSFAIEKTALIMAGPLAIAVDAVIAAFKILGIFIKGVALGFVLIVRGGAAVARMGGRIAEKLGLAKDATSGLTRFIKDTDLAIEELTEAINTDIGSLGNLGKAGEKVAAVLKKIAERTRELREERIRAAKAPPVIPGVSTVKVPGARPAPTAPIIDPKIAKIGEELGKRLAKIRILGDVLGESFDVNAEKIREYRIALEDLAEIGTPAAIAKMEELAAKMQELEQVTDKSKDAITAVFEDIKGAISTSIDGIIRDTTSLGEAFSNLGQSILLKFQSRAIDAMLDALSEKLLKVASSAKAASSFGAIGGGGIGGLITTGVQFLAGLFEKGGVVGKSPVRTKLVPARAFAGAPRMQFGGIAGMGPNEFPAILHRGETVTPAGSVAQAMAPININFNVTTPDAGSFQRSEGQITAMAARAIQRASRRNL